MSTATDITQHRRRIIYRAIWLDGEQRYTIRVFDDIATIYTCDVPAPLLASKLYDLQARYSDELPDPIPEYYELSDGKLARQN